MSFKAKRGIKLPYRLQGWVYFQCLNFDLLPQREQEKIRKLCRECGGEHEKALFRFLTTEDGYLKICNDYYLSSNTLYRVVKRFYEKYGNSKKRA